MKTKKRFLSILLSLVMVLGLMPGMSLTALAWDGDPYASLLNTTTVVKFDNKDWYLIENNSTALNAGTVTLLSKECVAASKYNSSGSYDEYASSTGLSGAMTDVVYTANEGYYFPENYSVTAVNGISVTRNSYTQITVSGTPTADAAITLTAPTAKATPNAPTASAATDCTTADNNDGKLTGVTTEME